MEPNRSEPEPDLVAIEKALSKPMRVFLRYGQTARTQGSEGLIDIAGDGAGEAATARALMRRGLVACTHPGGPSWGEFKLTPLGHEVAALLPEVTP
jgi:hypothetical protein